MWLGWNIKIDWELGFLLNDHKVKIKKCTACVCFCSDKDWNRNQGCVLQVPRCHMQLTFAFEQLETRLQSLSAGQPGFHG